MRIVKLTKGNIWHIKLIFSILFINFLTLGFGLNLQAASNASSGSSNHFVTVWDGENGFGHMNIYIVTAYLDNEPLSAGDEIAAFSGNVCVGTVKLDAPSNGELINLIASLDDGTGNGFVNNDTILFKVWDSSAGHEKRVVEVTYRNNMETWIFDGKFKLNESSFIDMKVQTNVTQTIELTSGWNIFSGYLISESPEMLQVMDSLIQKGSLQKVQDESGRTVENIESLGGWVNGIGQMKPTEGYKLKVLDDCNLSIKGIPVDVPVQINLNKGWNIISYPLDFPVNAEDIFQQLIANGTLEKVKDERGNSMEDWGIYGGWVNNIGNCEPGEGYEVNVKENTVLTISSNHTKSLEIFNEPQEAVHFISCGLGNGLDHMNINILSLNNWNVQEGDELAVFDGNLCVGAIKVTQEIIQDNALVINATSANGSDEGFKEGNILTLKVWKHNLNRESEQRFTILKGNNVFQKLTSSFIKLEYPLPVDDITVTENAVSVYPNPTQGQFSVVLSGAPTGLEVLDVTGKLIEYNAMPAETMRFNLEGQAAGIYFIRARYGSRMETRRLVIRN